MQNDEVKINYNDETSRVIKKEYSLMPKTRDKLLNEHVKELKIREQQLKGYRYAKF